MAVKLGHGVAISWDGRVIRHCTSVSCPDGLERGFVTGKRESPFRNYLYGTFTAAKEKIVEAGRAACADCFCPRKPSPVEAVMDRKKRPNRRRRRPRGGRPRIESGGAVVAGVGCPAVEFASVEPTVELTSGVPLVYSKGAGGEWRRCSDKRNKGDLGRDSLSHADWRKERTAGGSVAFGGWQVQPTDLEVGGRYRIPRKQKK